MIVRRTTFARRNRYDHWRAKQPSSMWSRAIGLCSYGVYAIFAIPHRVREADLCMGFTKPDHDDWIQRMNSPHPDYPWMTRRWIDAHGEEFDLGTSWFDGQTRRAVFVGGVRLMSDANEYQRWARAQWFSTLTDDDHFYGPETETNRDSRVDW